MDQKKAWFISSILTGGSFDNATAGGFVCGAKAAVANLQPLRSAAAATSSIGRWHQSPRRKADGTLALGRPDDVSVALLVGLSTAGQAAFGLGPDDAATLGDLDPTCNCTSSRIERVSNRCSS